MVAPDPDILLHPAALWCLVRNSGTRGLLVGSGSPRLASADDRSVRMPDIHVSRLDAFRTGFHHSGFGSCPSVSSSDPSPPTIPSSLSAILRP